MLKESVEEVKGIKVHLITFLLPTFDLNIVMDLEQKLDECLEENKSPLVILDIHNVGYIDSAVLGTLLRFAKNIQKKQRSLAVVGINQTISMVLRLTQTQDFLKDFNSIEKAVEDYIERYKL